jgi:hypothetical protein
VAFRVAEYRPQPVGDSQAEVVVDIPAWPAVNRCRPGEANTPRMEACKARAEADMPLMENDKPRVEEDILAPGMRGSGQARVGRAGIAFYDSNRRRKL